MQFYDLDYSYNYFSGSFYSALTTALLLGFENIYLIGFDAFTLSPIKNIRYYEYGIGEIGYNHPGIDPIYQLMKERMNIKVVIPDNSIAINSQYINYEDLTGHKPTYKESDEIMRPDYLKLMKEFNGAKLKSGYKL
jgi:hypothetical protein